MMTNEPSLATNGPAIKRIGIAIVEWKNSILVGVRQSGQVLEGYHEFPGGKCEIGENTSDCAIRECLEETGQQIQVLEKIETTVHEYPHGKVEIDFFRCELLGGCSENANTPLSGSFRWVPRSELAALSFPAANQAVVNRLLASWQS